MQLTHPGSQQGGLAGTRLGTDQRQPAPPAAAQAVEEAVPNDDLRPDTRNPDFRPEDRGERWMKVCHMQIGVSLLNYTDFHRPEAVGVGPTLTEEEPIPYPGGGFP